ncbi:MAG: hypothetical protein MJ186_00075 [Clostridia bacterium]|nr:hypothetical protein [Clostridia bacterium]
MKDVRLAFMGFGNVGQALAKMIIENRAEIFKKYDARIMVTAIATGSHGCLYNPKGINLEEALKCYAAGGFTEDNNADWTDEPADALVYCGEYDVLVELSPLNIQTGQPAANRIKHALHMKKSAVSANKGPIAWYYEDLKAMASAKGGKFLFESTVMDGTPIFNLRDRCLNFCTVKSVEGILNSTTNFVLKYLEEGKTFEEAIAEGQRQGFVEADPSMDIGGWDAAAKICVLANVLMGANITPDRVEKKGIKGITAEDVAKAREKGCCIKLMCRAETDEFGQTRAWVKPVEVPLTSQYASVSGASSIVQIETDLMGTIAVTEKDPTIVQTAYGVFQDILYTFI